MQGTGYDLFVTTTRAAIGGTQEIFEAPGLSNDQSMRGKKPQDAEQQDADVVSLAATEWLERESRGP